MSERDDNTDPTTVRQASREASGWMIRLQDAPDDAELRRRFSDWLADPVNAAAWKETERMSRAVAGAAPRHVESWGPFLSQVRAETKTRAIPGRAASRQAPAGRTNRRRVLRLAGLAAAASVLAIMVAPELAPRLGADHATATAETRTVRLADDSVVTVAPDSAIAVSYTKGERRVNLLAGEIYLDVTPDAGRPFRVATDSLLVTVLGTGFNVSQSDAGAEVGVAHGSVRVDRDEYAGPAAEALEAGEFVRVSRSGRVQRGLQPAVQIGAWRQNQLIAQDQPFAEMLDRLRRYHAGAIVLTDASLADQPVTGVYDLGNPVGALRAIARSQNAMVREITPWLLIVSRA